MAKRDKHTSKRKATLGRQVEPVTVGWMLAVMTTFVCELISVGLHWFIASFNPEAGGLKAFANLMLFAAFVIGVISLLMLPVVLKTRREPPPVGVLAFSVIVGIVPLLLAFLERYLPDMFV